MKHEAVKEVVVFWHTCIYILTTSLGYK